MTCWPGFSGLCGFVGPFLTEDLIHPRASTRGLCDKERIPRRQQQSRMEEIGETEAIDNGKIFLVEVTCTAKRHPNAD